MMLGTLSSSDTEWTERSWYSSRTSTFPAQRRVMARCQGTRATGR